MICLNDGITLHRSRSSKRPCSATTSRKAVRPAIRRPYQPACVRYERAGHHQDPLAGHGVIDSSRSRAARKRSAAARSSGPPGRSSSASQLSRAAIRSRTRGGDRGCVRRHDAGAHLEVTARQPGHVPPAARSQLGGLRPPGAISGSTRHRLDDRRGRQRAADGDRRHRFVVDVRGHAPTGARRSPSRAPPPARRRQRHRSARPPTGDRRRDQGSRRRNRSTRVRPSGDRRRTASRAISRGRRSLPSCWRRR